MLASSFVFPSVPVNPVSFDMLWSNPNTSADFNGGSYTITDASEYQFFFLVSSHPQQGFVVSPIIIGQNYIYTPANVDATGALWFITRLVNMQSSIIQFDIAYGKSVTSEAAGFQVLSTFKPWYLYGIK